jgi:acetyltransferase-like isoleucine patch superfamily enzyme
MGLRIHPTALVELDVEIGRGTVIGEGVHVSRGARIGEDCLLGAKAHFGAGVRLGDRVRIEPAAILCDGAVLEDAVLVGAGAVLAGAVVSRAWAPEAARPALVREGATIGAHCTVYPDLEVGRFAVTAPGSVICCSVADFHLVSGNPARSVGLACRCGAVLVRFKDLTRAHGKDLACSHCGLVYSARGGLVIEQQSGAGLAAA